MFVGAGLTEKGYKKVGEAATTGRLTALRLPKNPPYHLSSVVFFCFQSANYWLRSRHEQIEHFIHAGLIKKASLQFYPDEEEKRLVNDLPETIKKHRSPWGGTRKAPLPGFDDP
ncbi:MULTISPECIES: hypothetical protein [Enterobacter]|uniref:Uncharacterized protein n=1 Tax=Enterobacter dykesii TaxID=2797506 RepID=A0AAU7IVT5_9ENTR|nr:MULTISPECIES: hypothetical protein [Enterobacter]KAA0527255.1 hypothetical protein F0321_08830 [Enterobacter asburiae]KAA0535424.1 hypothetical protein F0320_01190 [Enterobacter dykesii]MCV3770932.1 hypothetical protein [Enterobacter sp. RD4-1-1]RTN83527.1 hypothetical protein EKN81_05205 [Enterobacter asburiae]RTP81929.1 hypothetical protein EKN32_05205 [Enterobacter asburiae]